MSNIAIKQVEYYTEGRLVKTETDAETARAIAAYKNVYNNINSFDMVSSTLPPKHVGFTREAIVAQSRRLKIVCIKEYLPNVPETIASPRYECGILNTKTGKFESVSGIVPMLYYKLFSEHTK